jgi:hypothetical protein
MKNAILRLIGKSDRIVHTPKKRYMHSEKEHNGFRILSVGAFAIITFVIEILIMITVFVMIGWQSFLFFFGLCFSVCFVVYKRYEADATEAMLVFFVVFFVAIGGVFVLG